jgi:phage terminase large subunit-like protein
MGELDSREYVLHDASGKYTPDGWSRQAAALFDHYRADRIVSEANLPFGEIVTKTLATVRANLPAKLIHARTGNRSRAEPVADERGRGAPAGVYKRIRRPVDLSGHASASPEPPDRLDAIVHALTKLMLGNEFDPRLLDEGGTRASG